MTDPIADFLTRIRNAIIARKSNVEVPSSRLKRRLAEVLRDEGYISSLEERGRGLILGLRYGTDNKSAIQNLRRVSRPGQRRYVRKDELPRIRSGLGISVLTTPRGIMTDRAARQAGLGGEVICEVW
jgi:small subunit ribosomal protein S8